jgi:phospholipid/cholesterol/gamma-HCH transport system permease protein
MSAWQLAHGNGTIDVAGELRMADAPSIWQSLRRVVAAAHGRLDICLDRARAVDGAVMALLVDTRASLDARGVSCEIVGGSPAVRELVHLYGGDQPIARGPTLPRANAITRLGTSLERLAKRVFGLVSFAGELVLSVGRAVRRPASANLRELPDLVARAGTDGTAIVLILNFLVGFVMAFQSTRPLEQYGANLFVADIVGISVTRELAPLMTAVIIAGRSGAAFAAELGTMRVSEEIDALRTMGISPVGHLVLPRILALAIVAPVLTLFGDVIGVFGGAVVGASALDVTPRAYLAELRLVLLSSDVWTGLVKSVAFGALIAFIGCYQGLSARGAASGVGRSTTTTVVACLFTIVIVDTLFTMLFRGVGL